MIKQKEKEFICIKMELHILGNGSMINNMDMEYKGGSTEHLMKVHLWMEWNKDTGHLFGVITVDLMDNLKITVLKDLDIMFGLMEDNTKVFGKATKWTVKEFFYGQIKGNMKVNTLWTKNKDMVFLLGLTTDATRYLTD